MIEGILEFKMLLGNYVLILKYFYVFGMFRKYSKVYLFSVIFLYFFFDIIFVVSYT